jgi:hypothetical protein
MWAVKTDGVLLTFAEPEAAKQYADCRRAEGADIYWIPSAVDHVTARRNFHLGDKHLLATYTREAVTWGRDDSGRNPFPEEKAPDQRRQSAFTG